jgi:hypothetical protein
VWGAIFQQIVLRIDLPGLDGANFFPNGDHGITEAIQLGFDSLSVGSTIMVPATGQDIVGGWKP